MFHFPTFPPHALCVQARVTPHDWCGVPPFGHPRINARLAAPRGFSQPPTSFIGSWCPGIHRVPLTTWPHTQTPPPHPDQDRGARAGLQETLTTEFKRCSRPLCSSQPTTGHHPTRPADPPPRGGGTASGRPRTRESRPLPQDPTACLRPTHPPAPVPAPARRPKTPNRCRTGSPRGAPAELVSVPPSSTTPRTRDHPRRAADPGAGAALDHPRTPPGGQCSLERR